nr:unnamed protein product [Callosobruchus analis]
MGGRPPALQRLQRLLTQTSAFGFGFAALCLLKQITDFQCLPCQVRC